MVLRHTVLLTLAGPLLAVATPDGLLRHLHLLPEVDTWNLELRRLTTDRDDPPILTEDPTAFNLLARQLGEYFSGLRQVFDLPLAPQGSAFQRRVWDQLLTIPYGQVRSYGRLAKDLGLPSAARAVGQAAGQNPLLILVPCHRLLGSDGRLVGFTAGTELKARLLRLEGHSLSNGSRLRPPRLF